MAPNMHHSLCPIHHLVHTYMRKSKTTGCTKTSTYQTTALQLEMSILSTYDTMCEQEMQALGLEVVVFRIYLANGAINLSSNDKYNDLKSFAPSLST